MPGDFYCDEVVSGRTPVEVVGESPRALAFRHTRPAYAVHVVVIPRAHIPSLLELNDSSLLQELIDLVRRVVREVLDDEGACRVVVNFGAYQDSPHLHWHVIAGAPEGGPTGAIH
jgi:histidine triad (HIT) family protein